MGARKILFVLALGCVCLQIITASQCSQQMDSMRQCVRSQMSKDQNDPTASDSRRQQMQSDLSNCASQCGCQNPFPSNQEQQARQQCFTDARNQIRRRLESCVRNVDSSFTLPGDDNDKDAYWQFVLLRSFAAMRTVGDNSRNRNRNNKNQWQKASGNQQANDICNNDDGKKANMMQCIKNKGTFNKTSGQSNWRKNSCKIKRQCNQVSTQCQQSWDNIQKPKLCDCVNQMKSDGTLKTLQDTYVTCLRNKGFRNAGNNDDGRTVVQRMLVSWCPQGKMNQQQRNQTDPCKQRRGNGRGRGNNGNHGNNGNNQNWNHQNGGTNVNANSNTNVDYPTSSADYPYDDGSSSSSSTDVNSNVFSSFLGGSDPLSSVSSLPAGGSSGLLGGDLLSSFTGGGSPLAGGLPFGGASPLGGGGLGGGLLSSFTGAGSPLGAGGGLLSSFTGGGASPLSSATALDASSSMGAFGGAGDMFSGLGGDSGNLLGSFGGF